MIHDFCNDARYRNLLVNYQINYQNRQNEIKSYLKNKQMGELVKCNNFDNIIEYMKQLAQINIENDQLQDELNEL